MTTPGEYQSLLIIDDMALDKEWLRQPSLYAKISSELAGARAELDRLKSTITLVEAKVEREVRANPAKYDILDKVTEKAVTAAVETHSKVITATKEYLEAKYECELLSGMLAAIDHRKEALKNLTQLYLANYYGAGDGPIRAQDAQEVVRRQRREKMSERNKEYDPRKK